MVNTADMMPAEHEHVDIDSGSTVSMLVVVLNSECPKRMERLKAERGTVREDRRGVPENRPSGPLHVVLRDFTPIDFCPY
ncbi:hypothetical protein EYF80_009881 [Liparis tanakae]|uniref:Uncharacterized protein n=1 Tax=Liparis tanakae TaxID=230148 RepID=A0A4Z2IQP4_9TELE|nr:hypothetical protein EYF80_009881 [Liparis tanakae]